MNNESESMSHKDQTGNGQLEARLRAYADARLAPKRSAAIRMRAAVLDHARSLPSYSRGSVGVRTLGARWPVWPRLRRPLLSLAVVMALVIGTGASAALAASPGSPLYGLRLWIEAATLPAAADARLDAQVQQTDTRVDEAVGAAGQGNGAAVSAALAAYRAEVNALLAAAGDDPATLARLRAELGRHLAALQALSVSNPEAAAAIQAAIAESQKVLDKIAAKTQSHGRPSQPPGRQ